MKPALCAAKGCSENRAPNRLYCSEECKLRDYWREHDRRWRNINPSRTNMHAEFEAWVELSPHQPHPNARKFDVPVILTVRCRVGHHALAYVYSSSQGPVLVATGDGSLIDREQGMRWRLRAGRRIRAGWEATTDVLFLNRNDAEAHPRLFVHCRCGEGEIERQDLLASLDASKKILYVDPA